jgi:hypothetical protein
MRDGGLAEWTRDCNPVLGRLRLAKSALRTGGWMC